MSSKRAVRRRACKGKVRHLTEQHGYAALRSLSRARDDGSRMNVYRCTFCGGFHVGHAPGQRRW